MDASSTRCPSCSNLMIKARAIEFGAEYDYCRTCKKELAEMGTDRSEPASVHCELSEQTVRKVLMLLSSYACLKAVNRRGNELYAKDDSNLECCRSIDGVPAHFWHRGYSLKSRVCQCGSYSHPGIRVTAL